MTALVSPEVLSKLASLGDIFSAATTLRANGLIDESPAEVVKRYISMNPDINSGLNNFNQPTQG